MGCYEYFCEVRGLVGFKNFFVRNMYLVLLVKDLRRIGYFSIRVRIILVILGMVCIYC